MDRGGLTHRHRRSTLTARTILIPGSMSPDRCSVSGPYHARPGAQDLGVSKAMTAFLSGEMRDTVELVRA
jgi:hypothetical protein